MDDNSSDEEQCSEVNNVMEENTDDESIMEEFSEILTIVDGKSKSITVGQQAQIKKLIHKMYEKINMQKGEIKTLKAILTNEVSNIRQDIKERRENTRKQQTEMKTTYAEATRTNQAQDTPKHKIIIKSKTDTTREKKIKEEIKNKINPCKSRIGINNVRKLRGGALEIETSNGKEKEKIKEIIEKEGKLEIIAKKGKTDHVQ